MFITSLRIKNFKHIKEIELKFKKFDDVPSIICFVGENWQGKSSILEALQYALTNYLPENLEEYIRWGQDKFEIQLDVDLHAYKSFSYTIEYSKKKSEKRLWVNTIKQYEGGGEEFPEEFYNSDAVNEIVKLINPTMALYSTFSMQKENTEILKEKGAERLKRLKTLFGLDSIDPLVEELKTENQELEKQETALDSERKTLHLREFKLLKEPELKDFSDLEEKYKQWKAEIKVFAEQEKKYVEYLSQNNKYTNYIAAKNKLSASLESLVVKRLPRFDEVNFKTIEKQFSEMEKYVHSYKTDQNTLAQYKIEMEKLKKTFEAFQDSEEKYEEAQKKEEELSVKNLRITYDIEEAQKHLDLAKAGRCHYCKQEFHSATSITDLSLNLEQLQQDYTDTTFFLKQIQKNLLELDNNYKLYSANSSKFELIEEKAKDLEESIRIRGDSLFQEYDRIKQELDELTLSKIKYQEAKQGVDLVLSKRKFYEEELKKLVEVEKSEEVAKPTVLSFTSQDFLDLEVALGELLKIKAEVESTQKRNEQIKLEQKENEKKITTIEEQLRSIRHQLRVQKESVKILEKNFTSFLIETGSALIAERMNNFFQKTHSSYSLSLRKDKRTVNFYYTPDGKHFSPASMASGFEKDLLSLSCRIALCSMQDTGIYAGDEIDSDGSVGNSTKLFTNLISCGIFRQIFLVTHNEESKEYLSTYPYCSVYEIKAGEVYDPN